MPKTCKCEGLHTVLSMARLYKELDKVKSTPEQRKRAMKITEEILSKISEDDVYEGGESPKLWRGFIRGAKESGERCRESDEFSCMMALENVRAAIHGDWGLRAKMLCDLPFKAGNQSKANEDILRAMYNMRGYGTVEDAIERIEGRIKKEGC